MLLIIDVVFTFGHQRIYLSVLRFESTRCSVSAAFPGDEGVHLPQLAFLLLIHHIPTCWHSVAVRVVVRDVHAVSASALAIVGIVFLHQVLVLGSLAFTCMRFRYLRFATLLLILLLLELSLVLLDLAVEEVAVALVEEARG